MLIKEFQIKGSEQLMTGEAKTALEIRNDLFKKPANFRFFKYPHDDHLTKLKTKIFFINLTSLLSI